MNYTIVGHTSDGSYFDRGGNYVEHQGNFDHKFFRADQREEFLRDWAYTRFHKKYDTLTIAIDGVPDYAMTAEEYDRFEEIEGELDRFTLQVKADHERELEKQAAAKAVAIEQQAQEQRARDVAQLVALKQRLGVI